MGIKQSKKEAVSDMRAAAYRSIEEDLKSAFGTKVNVKPSSKSGKGKIEIEYYSEEELERLLMLLKRE